MTRPVKHSLARLLIASVCGLSLASCGGSNLKPEASAPITKSENQSGSNSASRILNNPQQEQHSNTPSQTQESSQQDSRAQQNIHAQQPKKVALLLPTQGRLAEAGEAVRDGFFAAYYQQFKNTQNLPSVKQYDTSKGAQQAYQQAVSEGAELVIGPLDKEDVNQISKLNNLKVPLLSLNYPDQQPAQALKNFYQFGLAVEDEAKQVARQAVQEGRTHVLIISNGQDVSERTAQAFINELQKLGGSVIAKTTFVSQDKFSQNLGDLMLIDQSQARATLLQQQLLTKFEFTPRRRSDIDLIFLAVNPAQARQIKPTLAFQYANTIPVYATSSIYSGDADASNNEDLNGILFNTLPWIFDNANPEKQSIAQNTKSSAIYGRLHALGADAFHLYARLSEMQSTPETRIYGATGNLHLESDGRIEREQLWAQFNNGLAEPVNAIVTAMDGDKTE